MCLGVVGLLVAHHKRCANNAWGEKPFVGICPYPWRCLWMIEEFQHDVVYAGPFLLHLLLVFKVYELFAVGLVLDTVSLPLQLYLRKRWLRNKKRQELKAKMLHALRMANMPGDARLRMVLDGMRRRAVL